MADPRGWGRVRRAAYEAVLALAPVPRGVPDAVGLVLAAPLAGVPAGTELGPFAVALAQQAAVAEVLVHPRPRAAVLVTGDGLGPVATALPLLIRAVGGAAGPAVWVPDDPTALDLAMGMVDGPDAACDVLVVLGDARGELRAALSSAGAALVVDGIAMRPGGSGLLATLPSGRAVVGLPGPELAILAAAATLLIPVLTGLRGAPLPPAEGLTIALEDHRDVTATVSVQTADGSPAPDRDALRVLATGGRLVVVTPSGATVLLEQ